MRTKASLLLFFCCLLHLCGLAQKGVIKGAINDSASGQPLSLASVTVFAAKDTAVITYRLSDPSGAFQVSGIPLALACRVVISFQGYKVWRKEFTLTKEVPQLNLDTVFLTEDTRALDEIFITAERPPVAMRNDTLEFNANAFKTLPSALVEDLLKKLPGVDVDLDGNITVRGRKVNRLLVDGKEFFGADPRIATRNLPANIVDKVQVTDDRDEQRRRPLLRKDEVGQVVNIKLKKAVRQGWFGKAYAGGGTDRRHEAGAIVNLFRDTAQLSVMAHSNNVNKPGFDMSDLQNIGGYNRGGSRIDYQSDEGGIQHSLGGGLNFNNRVGKTADLNLQYFYKEERSESEQKSNARTFLADTVLNAFSAEAQRQTAGNHRLAGNLQWRMDSVTSLRISPDISIGKSRSATNASSFTADNFKGPVNGSKDEAQRQGTSTDWGGSLSFSTASRRREGRSFNADISSSSSRNDGDNYNDGLYAFYTAGNRNDSLLQRLNETGWLHVRHRISLNFTELLSERASLTLSNEAEYEKDKNNRLFFDREAGGGKYALYRDDLSNGAEGEGWQNTTTAALSLRLKEWSFTPGLNLLWLNRKNHFVKSAPVTQRYLYAYPSLNVNWKSWTLSYNASVSPPDASSLQDVVDISDPLYKEYGNRDLRPSFHHSISLYCFKFFPGSGSSFNFSLHTVFSSNVTATQTTLDSNRVHITRPVNASGTQSHSFNGSYNRQYKFSNDFRFSVRPTVNASYHKSFVFVNDNSSQVAFIRASFNLNLQASYIDLLELNQRYVLNLNQSHYADKSAFRDAELIGHDLQSEAVLRWPAHVVWESSVTYTYNPQVASGIRPSAVRWNAAVSYLFLKEDKAQLKLSVYDVLNQNVELHRYAWENSIYDVQSMTLRQYSLLSFIYNIRSFGSGKAKKIEEEYSW